MQELLIAIRNVLVADATLIALVPADDILSQYTQLSINYPRVAISLVQSSEAGNPDGVHRCVIGIEIWNETSKLTNWNIHNRIRTLLHRQETSITDANVAVHSIESAGVQGNYHQQTTRTFKMNTSYVLLCEEL